MRYKIHNSDITRLYLTRIKYHKVNNDYVFNTLFDISVDLFRDLNNSGKHTSNEKKTYNEAHDVND